MKGAEISTKFGQSRKNYKEGGGERVEIFGEF